MKHEIGKTFVGQGFDLEKGNELDIRDVYISDNARQAHILGLGTTRYGKTRLIETMIEQDIRNGRSVIYIDPKLDQSIFAKIAEIAFEEDREDDLMFFSPVFPELSVKVNPFSSYFLVEELVAHVVSGIKVGKEPFFKDIAYEATDTIIESLLYIRARQAIEDAITFQDIKDKVTRSAMQSLQEDFIACGGDRDMPHIMTGFDQILSSDQQYYSKISSSLRTTLTKLSYGNVGKVINGYPGHNENEFIKRLEDGRRVIMVVQTASLLIRDVAFVIARVIISMIQSFVGRVLAMGGVIKPELCLYIDEASNVFYEGVEDMFNKAGGAGVWISAFTQSLADIVAEIGADRAKKVADNTNTKIILKVNDVESREYISRLSGLARKFSPIMGLGGSLQLRSEELPLVSVEDIGTLRPRDFILIGADGRFKGTTNYSEEARVPVTTDPKKPEFNFGPEDVA